MRPNKSAPIRRLVLINFDKNSYENSELILNNPWDPANPLQFVDYVNKYFQNDLNGKLEAQFQSAVENGTFYEYCGGDMISNTVNFIFFYLSNFSDKRQTTNYKIV